MVEPTIQTNRDTLIDFFDFAAAKGLMNKNTATAYKKACSVILKILEETEYNVSKAARKLKLPRTTLQSRLKKYFMIP